jgi:AcrR family transcriptional regulator
MTEKKDGQNDLRVIKTKRAITAAFNELLNEKSLDKISVTELAQRAEINKGTFYLHYTDIYALYQEALQEHMKKMVEDIPFFDYLCTDPHKFSEMLLAKNDIREKMFKNDPYLAKKNAPWNRNAFNYFTEAVGSKAVEKAGLEPTEENRIKLMYLFAGAGSLLRMESDRNHEMLVNMLTQSIYALFPEAKK